jgi:very-short-patch-repair endonuclease
MTKSDTNSFTKKAMEIWGNKYDYSLVDYISAREKIKIIYNGWVFEQTPDNHLRGKECEKRWDTKRFIFESKKIHGTKYDYSLVKFKNMNSPVRLLLEGEVWLQTPCKHLMGRQIDRGRIIRTTDEFIKDSKRVWDDKYDYSLVDYKGSHVPVKIIYNGKIYRQKPCQHLMGMKCERDIIRNSEDFIRKAIDRYGNKYDYSLVEYKGIDKKVKIIYNNEVFEQKAGAHLYAKGLVEKRINKKTTSIFINESNSVHDFLYDYSKVDYINNHTKVIIICKKHGEFLQTPGSHLQGSGCPFCMESSGEKEISKFLRKNNINFIREHRFSECRGKKHKLPFDFYIPMMRTCIEFDGKQHFQPMDFFGGKKSYDDLKINDKIKSEYCEDNYIDLIRIRYDQIENIHQILWENLKNRIHFCGKV